MKLNKLIILLSLAGLLGCGNNENESDAFGNFETTDIILSSEVAGKVISTSCDEGDQVKIGDAIAVIDTTMLVIKRNQLLANINAVKTRLNRASANVKVLETQKAVIKKELDRVTKMFESKAATSQAFDKVEGELSVVNERIEAARLTFSEINAEVNVLNAKVDEVNEMIKRSVVKTTMSGVVLQKFVETGEVTAPGKPLVKIGDIQNMVLKAYVSGNQLVNVQIGQEVQVLFDKTKKENHSIQGVVSWIASEAEFTPKIIQTKEERVDLVYAVKVEVVNDGRIKIGMPGEVKF